MILLVALVIGVLAYAAARALLPATLSFLTQGGLVRRNYRGVELPASAGIVIPLASVGPWIALLFFPEPGNGWSGRASATTLWIALLFGMALLGMVDDALGNRQTTGLKGHVRALLAGRPTTGSFKALFGGVLSLYAGVLVHGPSLAALISGMLVALCTNAVNLLDVRPGRALKGAIFGSLLGMTAAWLYPGPWASSSIVHAAAPLGAGLALWQADHKGSLMLGDTGANVLGATAGIVSISTPLLWQLLLLGLLILMHLYSERRSLSDLIDAVPLLSRLDRWGR